MQNLRGVGHLRSRPSKRHHFDLSALVLRYLGEDPREWGRASLSRPPDPFQLYFQDVEMEPDGARPNRCPSNVTQTINPLR